MAKRLAIITTHPIQYNAPLFTMLAMRGQVSIKVFYTWGERVLQEKYDPGFGKNIEWDIPLLEGYDYSFVKNIAAKKGSHHFKGIDNPGLINEIENWKADAVLIYGWAFKSHLKAMRYFHGKKTVLFRGDSVSIEKLTFFKSIARNSFLKWVYRHIDYALYVGTNNKNYFEKLGLKKSQLIFAPHAVDNDRFYSIMKSNEKSINEWRQSLGIAAEDIVFLYAGKLDENKNVNMLATAFSKLNAKNTHLVIAGNGVTEQELKKDYSGNNKIHLLPFQNQSKMPLLYGIADSYVLPSISETWGLGINEAMACGKAVLVSSSCGGALDLVKDGENGFLFSSNNREDLQLKLGKMASDKKALIKMGDESFRIIKEWNFRKTSEAIENLII